MQTTFKSSFQQNKRQDKSISVWKPARDNPLHATENQAVRDKTDE